MPSTDRKLELKAKTLMAQTASQAAVYAKGLTDVVCKVWQALSAVLLFSATGMFYNFKSMFLHCRNRDWLEVECLLCLYGKVFDK
jgi:hypothetical protein